MIEGESERQSELARVRLTFVSRYFESCAWLNALSWTTAVQLYCFQISDTSVASGNLDANKRYPSVNDAFSSAEGLAVILIYFIQLGISGLFAYWDWRQLKDNKAGCRQKLMDLLPFTLATISQSFWNFHGILMVFFFRRTIKVHDF